MAEDLDFVARYARSIGLEIHSRTVLVEGTTDVALLRLAADLDRVHTGSRLIADGFGFVAAGIGESGGTTGVIRELVALRGMARTCLLPNGRPRYRFVGLFDDDRAGKRAVKTICEIDNGIIEYRDVFRLRPVMPIVTNLDPGAIGRAVEAANAMYKGLDWELEDLIPTSFFDAFSADNPSAISSRFEVEDRVHRNLTRDGKARFHRYIRDNAIYDDLRAVVEAVKAIRCYAGVG